MGTICAPAYANTFMAYFKEKFICSLIDAKTLLCLRFIDDIFLVWTKSEKDLIEFLNELNTKHTSFKFEFKYSRQQIVFPDTVVYIDNNNKLQTTLYKEPTDRQNYLHSKSEHPYSLKMSIALCIGKPCVSKGYRQHKTSSRNIQAIFCSNSKRKVTNIRLKNRLKKQGYWKEHFY